MVNRKFLCTVLLYTASVIAAPLLADIQFTIEEPAKNSTKSGIGLISGWAVSDNKIVLVEVFIDGASLGEVPYGGSRQDVAAVFPELPDSEFSGWAVKWNHALLENGEHTIQVVVTEDSGAQATKEVVFNTTGFNSSFISDPTDVRTSGTVVSSPQDGRILIEGAEVEGEVVDIELAWDTASQQFLIVNVDYGQEPKENQAPTAVAGINFSVTGGEPVSIEGDGFDPDGTISSYAWSQVLGPDVSLVNADQKTVQFTAPEEAGQVRLRLTVTDNEGASDSDDVQITVEAPVVENQPPTANAGADRAVDQGDNVLVAGSASDPDGTIASWSWQQVSGPAVSLSNADSAEVQFTAPATAGDIRLRLTVSDDDGATDSDDVIITVNESSGPDNTTGETLQSMLPFINQARSVSRFCGETEYPAQPDLQWSSSLADVARQHSMDMARQGYFSHTSLDGTSMGARVFPFWSGTTVGENIAASSIDRPDSYIVDLWIDSPGHCALLMSPNFTHAGVGSGHDTDNGYNFFHFWTLDFGG